MAAAAVALLCYCCMLLCCRASVRACCGLWASRCAGCGPRRAARHTLQARRHDGPTRSRPAHRRYRCAVHCLYNTLYQRGQNDIATCYVCVVGGGGVEVAVARSRQAHARSLQPAFDQVQAKKHPPRARPRRDFQTQCKRYIAKHLPPV